MTIDLDRVLESTDRFAGLPAQDLQILAAAMRVRSYDESDEIVSQGDSADGLYLLVEGQCEVWRRPTPNERSRCLARLGPGDMIGLIALVDNHPRSATVVAKGPVKAAFLPHRAFTMLFESGAPISVRFQRLVACQFVRDARQLNLYLLGSATEAAPDLRHLLTDALPARRE